MSDESTGANTATGSTGEGSSGSPPSNDAATNGQTGVADGAGTGSADNTRSFAEFIPSEYREREDIANILKTSDPAAELLKQYVNAQTLVGKPRPVEYKAPPEDATPEQVGEFLKSIGVPENIEGYAVTATPWSAEDKIIGEALESSRTPEFMADLKEAAKKAGVSAKQFQQMKDAYDLSFLKAHKEDVTAALESARSAEEAKQAITETFQPMLDKMYPPGPKQQEATNLANGLLEKYANVSKPYISSLPAEALAVMTEVLVNVAKTHIQPDTVRSLASRNTSPVDTSSAEGIRARITENTTKLVSLKAGSQEYLDLKKETDQLYARENELRYSKRR